MTCLFSTFTWGKVLEKSARPGIEPGTLGNLGQRSYHSAIEVDTARVHSSIHLEQIILSQRAQITIS